MPPHTPNADHNTEVLPVLVLNKTMGQTPLECIEAFRVEHPQYAAVPMTYAGRLDPLATGALIALTGDECKKKDAYLALDKVYEVTFLFGVQTDTHDVLGIPTVPVARVNDQLPTRAEITEVLNSFVGTFDQAYPIFSSRTVDGVPLFELARRPNAADIVLPSHKVNIFSVHYYEGSYKHVSAADLAQTAKDMIARVRGDFRQQACLNGWDAVVAQSNSAGPKAPAAFVQARFRIHCSHGTYMRQLAVDSGARLKCGGIALTIHRVRVGSYRVENS